MAYVRINNNPYTDKKSVETLIRYAVIDKKTGGLVRYYGGLGVCTDRGIDFISAQFWLVKRVFGKTEGRQVRHIYVSFSPDEHVGPVCASQIAFLIAQYYGNRFQILYGIHEDTDNLHIHFILNTVSYIDGKKFNEGFMETRALKEHVNNIIQSFYGFYRSITLDAFVDNN